MEIMLAIVALVLFLGMVVSWAMLPGSISSNALEGAEGVAMASAQHG